MEYSPLLDGEWTVLRRTILPQRVPSQKKGETVLAFQSMSVFDSLSLRDERDSPIFPCIQENSNPPENYRLQSGLSTQSDSLPSTTK
jgi:hypothetical protein